VIDHSKKKIFSRLAAIFSAFLLLSGGGAAAEHIGIPIKESEHLIFGIPEEPDLLLSRRGFAVGYSRRCRQAIWVSYILSSERLTMPPVKRSNRFQPDPALKVRPVRPRDYTRTGYDRGHLAPAADMTYSMETMEHSFFMTNISPQLPGCNRGIWKRLETQVRRWALREGRLCIVTGPVFAVDGKMMGRTDIPLPVAFYKVILDLTPPYKMIAFVIPNAPSKRRLQSFVLTVDEVEKLTGCDFFSGLDDALENELEKRSDFNEWR